MILSTSTPEAEVLAFINSHLSNLFPDYFPLAGFKWQTDLKRHKGSSRDRWAGCYSPNLICLNPQFFSGLADPAQQHEAIEDVLLHELCHHIQRLKWGNSDPPHGKNFRTLAYYVNGKMGRDSVTIYHALAKTPEGLEAERAQRKALALLARTTSSNEHEAALAAAKFAQFTAENNIILDAHAEALADGLPIMVKEHIWTTKKMSGWLCDLLNVVAYVNACQYTFIRSYDAYTKIHFYGRPVKISQAYDLLDYLAEAVDRVVLAAKKEAKKRKPTDFSREFARGVLDPFGESSAPKGRSYWISFREGVVHRVAAALRTDHKRRMSEGVVASNGVNHIPGLVLQSAFTKEMEATKTFVHEVDPSIRHFNFGAKSHAGRSAGYAAGSSVSVSRQTTGTNSRSLSAAR